MRKKKFIAMALVAMLSLSGLTGCSDKDKADISNKLNNKTTETTKKDDSKADDKTSESKPDNKSDNNSSDKPANKPSSGNNGSASQPNSNNSSANKPSSGNSGNNASKPSNGNSGNNTSKPSNGNSGNNAPKPHEHHWVDHTATKQVPHTVHHDAVYETVTIPAVTQTQEQCLGCKQWFNSFEDIDNHAMKVQMGMEAGDPQRCGSVGGVEREVVITPAHTEQKLVKEAYDETVYDTQTYVDYQECTGCGQHK